MSNQSIIEHKANMFYVEFREDYLAICLACTYKKPVKGKDKSKASPYCKSLILAISESWTNEKRGSGTDLSFYMTYPQWIDSMYGMFGRNVVIDSIDELIGEKLLSREPMRLHGKDTYRYLLNHAEINRRMKNLNDRTPYNTRPQVNAFTSKRDDNSTGLQVNGNAFTNQRDTSLLVNGNAFTSKPNIESTYHLSITSTQNTEESTYSVSVENAAASGTDVPTRALSSRSDLSTQATTSQATSEQDSVARENEYHSQLSTSQASYPRESVKVEPRPSTYQPPARVRNKSSKNKVDYRISWSVEGAAFRGWYEEIFGIVLDETAANARACNALGKRASVTYENVKLVQAEISQNKWVKKEHVAVTVQDLAKDDGVMRWERWLQSAQERTRKATPPPAPPVEDNPYSLAVQLARNPLPTLGVTV